MGDLVYFHASPTVNRSSIHRLGLRAHALGTRDCPYSGRAVEIPRLTVFAIDGQPEGTYLAHTLDGCRAYIQHVFDRFQPRPAARLGSMDIWQVAAGADLELADDCDWVTPASVTGRDIAPNRLTLVETVVIGQGRR